MRTTIFSVIALSLAVSARADVSDSGNLTIGGNGVIQGTVTVQGNAFSVGGSTFSVSGGTVQVGGLLRVSASGLQWNDGSVSTTAANGGGSASTFVSTYTYFANTSEVAFTNTAWSAAVLNSTITYTATGGRALIGFSCPATNDTAGQSTHAGVLVNGALIDGESSTYGFAQMDPEGGNSRDSMLSFTHLTQSTYTGATSFALIFRVSASTGRLRMWFGTACQFWVQEMK